MIRPAGLALAAAHLFANPAESQQVPTRTLAAPQVELSEPFSKLASIRELSDGRVIAVDARESNIQVVDLRSQTVKRIGRIGDGPGEYRMPAKLFALGGDSTAVADMAHPDALLVILPSGVPAAHAISLASASPAGRAPGTRALLLMHVQGSTDARGRVYFEVHGARRADSIPIARWDRGSGRIDTIARTSLEVVSPLFTKPKAGDNRPRPMGELPFDTFDQWAVSRDGRIALVSASPYRVRFVDPGGGSRSGPVIPFEPVRVTERLKEQYRREQKLPMPVVLHNGAGNTTAGFQRFPYREPTTWPASLPPFFKDAAVYAPDGMLWIARAHGADESAYFDVIDASGTLRSRVALPKQTRFVGFGANSVYLVRIDSDDLEYLQRYALPR